MGRALPIAAALLIVIAAGVWLMWPTNPGVRPAPGNAAAAGGDAAKPPALATSGTRSPAGDATPAASDAPGAAQSAAEAAALRAKEPWRGTLELTGRIVDAAGKPVAGAKVRAKSARPWPGEPPLPAVETGADGRFAFQDLASGPFQLWVDVGAGERLAVASFPPGQGPIDVPPPPTPPAKAAAPADLVVRVVGPDGKPIPRADVLIRNGAMFGGFGDLKDGQLFPQAQRDSTTYEVLRARDVDATPLPIGPGTWRAGSPESVLTLPIGKTLEGRVLGPDGQGVLGAEVSAHPDPGGGVGLAIPDAHGKATTDSSGRFRFVSLGDGPYRLQTTPLPPFLPAEPVESAVNRTDVVIRVVPGLEADITVLDAAGEPVAGAIVSARPTRFDAFFPRGHMEQVTDGAGRAHLSQMDPARTYGLTVSPPRSRKDLGKLDQRAWTPAATTVRLDRAWVLRGTVRRADGAEKKSHVYLRNPDGTWRYTAMTKADGSFEIPGLTGGPWVLAGSSSPNGPRGPEVQITDPALAVELSAPAAAAAPAPAPTK